MNSFRVTLYKIWINYHTICGCFIIQNAYNHIRYLTSFSFKSMCTGAMSLAYPIAQISKDFLVSGSLLSGESHIII